jgi:hypothetical protein
MVTINCKSAKLHVGVHGNENKSPSLGQVDCIYSLMVKHPASIKSIGKHRQQHNQGKFCKHDAAPLHPTPTQP